MESSWGKVRDLATSLTWQILQFMDEQQVFSHSRPRRTAQRHLLNLLGVRWQGQGKTITSEAETLRWVAIVIRQQSRNRLMIRDISENLGPWVVMNLDCPWTYTFIMVKYLTQTKIGSPLSTTQQNKTDPGSSLSQSMVTSWNGRQCLKTKLAFFTPLPKSSMYIHVYPWFSLLTTNVYLLSTYYNLSTTLYSRFSTIYLPPNHVSLPRLYPKPCISADKPAKGMQSFHAWMDVGWNGLWATMQDTESIGIRCGVKFKTKGHISLNSSQCLA